MTEGEGLGMTCVARYGAFEFPIVPFSLTNALTTRNTLAILSWST